MKYKVFEWKTISESENKIPDGNFIKKFDEYKKNLDKRKSIGNFENRKIKNYEGKDIYNGGSNVGVIEFGTGYRLELKPKIYIEKDHIFWKFLPKMLNSLADLEEFYDKMFLDPNKPIKLPRGLNIVPLLTLSFVSLLQKIIEKGLLKKYVIQEAHLNSIRGKINFSELIRKKTWDLSLVPCKFYDLTFDNPENQIILWCAHKLLKETHKIEVKNNKEIYIVKKLREQYSLLGNEISLIPKTIYDLSNLNLSTNTLDYLEMMNLCKAIIRESLFSLTDEKEIKENIGISFIIDMDWVFEQYMTKLFKEVVEESFKAQLKIESQKTQNLCDKNRIKIRPDLVIKEKNDSPLSVIDFKWKEGKINVNADFYQVICYGLAELQKYETNRIETSLFSVSTEKESGGLKIIPVDEVSKIFKIRVGIEKKISISKIVLNSELLNENDPNFIELKIKKEIREYLEDLVNRNDVKN